jgi:hypothetical protein
MHPSPTPLFRRKSSLHSNFAWPARDYDFFVSRKNNIQAMHRKILRNLDQQSALQVGFTHFLLFLYFYPNVLNLITGECNWSLYSRTWRSNLLGGDSCTKNR